jgi:hypothetical protein
MARKKSDNLKRQSCLLWRPSGKRKHGRPREIWMKVADRESKAAVGKDFTKLKSGRKRRAERKTAPNGCCRADRSGPLPMSQVGALTKKLLSPSLFPHRY